MPMMNGWKWLVLALWGLLPLFCQAQTTCASAIDYGTKNPYFLSSRVLYQVSTTVTLTGQTQCGIRPTSTLTPGGVTVITQSGLTVDFNKMSFRYDSGLPSTCRVSNDGTINFYILCNAGTGAGAKVKFYTQYLFEGKSTTTASNIVFFTPSLVTFSDINNTSTYASFNDPSPFYVPASPAATCSTTIDPPNLALGTIKPTDLSGAVGSFTTLGQKPFKLTMSCMANALAQANTFVPTFQFNNPLIVFAGTDYHHISRAVTADPGFGFRVLDPSGTAIKSGMALSSVTFPFTTPASAQSISRSFTVQYAKTLSNINPGVASSTITVTISFQ